MSKKHMGSSMDDFLKEEGIFEEAQALAVKEVVAWQIAEAMKKNNLKGSDGQAAQDEPQPGGPPAGSAERHHALEPATGGRDGWTPGDD